uniref:Uncharacterized protein n=1 Tax=Pyricularia oryzae (strain P131) TaxID=1143193 RepID=L7JM93_PYRO1
MQYPVVLAITMLISLGQAGSARTNEVAKQPFVVRNIGDNWVTKVKRDGVDGDDEADIVPRGLFGLHPGRGCVHDGVQGTCNPFGKCELIGKAGEDKNGKPRKSWVSAVIVGRLSAQTTKVVHAAKGLVHVSSRPTFKTMQMSKASLVLGSQEFKHGPNLNTLESTHKARIRSPQIPRWWVDATLCPLVVAHQVRPDGPVPQRAPIYLHRQLLHCLVRTNLAGRDAPGLVLCVVEVVLLELVQHLDVPKRSDQRPDPRVPQLIVEAEHPALAADGDALDGEVVDLVGEAGHDKVRTPLVEARHPVRVKVAGFVEPDEPAWHGKGVRHEAQGDELGFPIGLEGTVQISPALGQIRTRDGHPAVSVALAVAVVWDAPYVKVEQKGLGDKMSPYEESHLGGQ